MRITFTANTAGAPAGKLADAELHFDEGQGALAGLKLVGFSVWERRGGGRNVTFPARSYSVNGERRSFALLRPASGELAASEQLRDRIIDAYAAWERGDEQPAAGAPAATAQASWGF